MKRVLFWVVISAPLLFSNCGKPQEKQVMKHDEPPKTANNLPPEILRKMEAVKNSPYYRHVKELEQHVVDRTVTKTEAGTSGFVLYLDNGRYVLAYLAGNEFRWKMGDGVATEADAKLVNSASFGDASTPIKADVPYADQPCNFYAQVNNALGRRIIGLSYGEQCFNFCFPDGRELDVTLRQDAQGRLGYRVYWEQW